MRIQGRTVRLKGENSVAMGNAHRSGSLGTPSLKDLHKLQMVCGSLSGFRSAADLPIATAVQAFQASGAWLSFSMGVAHRYAVEPFRLQERG